MTDFELKVNIFPSSHKQTQKAANLSWLVKRSDCVCVCVCTRSGESDNRKRVACEQAGACRKS